MDNLEKHTASRDNADQANGEILNLHASYTKEEEKAVLRKIDLVILPFMCFVFFLQYLDKQSLSYAGVFGLIEDLNMTSSQYSWSSSIFYVGQLVAEYPFIHLMSRLPLTKFVGVTIIVWGIVCMCLAAPKNFAGFSTVRFLLGFSEGAVSPAFVTITSIWYRKKEHNFRAALWISMNGLAQVLGCFLMYGIGKNSSLPIAPWRVLFIICGVITSAAGVAFFFLMPNGPKDAWFLNAREREVLSLRMALDREGGDKSSFSVAQLKEAIMDPKAWVVFWFGVLSPVFASLVNKSIGYTNLETMLYTAPSGAVQIALLWIGVGLVFIFPNQRTLVILILISPPLIGTVFLTKLDVTAQWGLIVASWLSSCITASMTILLSLAASNFRGNAKRAVVNGMFFIGYCAACIASPQLWTPSPRCDNIHRDMVSAFVVVILFRFLCVWDNKQRDEQAASAGVVSVDQKVKLDENGLPQTDLTDKQDRQFRY
ncbi:hypothetical protein N7527_002088, partial [Penicillium freii]